MALTTAWGLASVGWGASQLAGQPDPWQRGFAIQQVAWGAIDAGIGLWAWQDFERRRTTGEDLALKPWLHDLYVVNAALDLGYMAVGAWLLAQPDEAARGHGAGLLVQGGWLALFDGANALLTR